MISSSSGELFSGGAFGLAVAVAGNNSHGEMNPRILRDYPRVCGEQVCMAFISVFVKRITPAYAGNSSQESERPYGAWDYPCVCGE